MTSWRAQWPEEFDIVKTFRKVRKRMNESNADEKWKVFWIGHGTGMNLRVAVEATVAEAIAKHVSESPAHKDESYTVDDKCALDDFDLIRNFLPDGANKARTTLSRIESQMTELRKTNIELGDELARTRKFYNALLSAVVKDITLYRDTFPNGVAFADIEIVLRDKLADEGRR